MTGFDTCKELYKSKKTYKVVILHRNGGSIGRQSMQTESSSSYENRLE